MKVGSYVEVVEDEYPEMVGLRGYISEISKDGTCAVVEFGIPVLCALCNLVEVETE